MMENESNKDNRTLERDYPTAGSQESPAAFPIETMTPSAFIDKWRGSQLKERSGSQEHFLDLCRLLGEPTPAEADPTGRTYCFERGARKDSGRAGWADVWKRGHFAWEYKGKHANLDVAFDQLRQYALALENPPLLIVSDMERFRIRTNWTNSVSKTHEFGLEDLGRAEVRNLLKWAMSAPERLQPGITRQTLTEQTATTFANLAQTLRQRGEDPRVVAQFVNRLVFCMFAEDVDLLPDNMFTRMLEQSAQAPNDFVLNAQQLFQAMAVGSKVGFESVAWFNGGLFDDDTALPLKKAEIATVLETATLDWADIDPAILGTLFERGLDPDKRSQLGAHYTDRDMIMRIIEPVITAPWLAEWETTRKDIEQHLARAETAKTASTRNRRRGQADSALNTFLERLRRFTVLDPACGSGNFLYLALNTLKDLEHLVQLEAEALGLAPGLRFIGPQNVTGIEINPYAAELARVSVWIGEIQWMRRNGFAVSTNPILKPLDTIECRDALMNPDGTESKWPEADVIVGNPPFLGAFLMRSRLGDDYVDGLRHLYRGRASGGADLVCYWFAKSAQALAEDRTLRTGLVATNSIRDGRNREILDRVAEKATIFHAWSDEPWFQDGAAVRVSQVCFANHSDRAAHGRTLDGLPVPTIHADLTAGTLDFTRTNGLMSNVGVSFRGNAKAGDFDVSGDDAREWLQLPANPNGRANSDVLKPLVNGADLMGRSSDRWIIDFGASMSESEAAFYEAPFAHVLEHIKPVRINNRDARRREHWWIHGRARPAMWRSIRDLPRFIVTPETSPHRVFAWLNRGTCPDNQLVVIARDDDTIFGILHSRFHEAWSLHMASWMGKGNDPRYTTTTTFQTFPFPARLGPDVPTTDYASNPRAIAIADAAKNLVTLRNRWLNPPEWVEWVEEPVPGYPKRPVPRDAEAAAALKQRTLTKLYNGRPAWLSHAHEALDATVAEAYGWPTHISEDDALAALLALNLERSKAETR
ncbi:MAG: N-6 DNA methylase [Caldilineaceae bacterium]|nr:N-6 DNA methylase [Caldilineaceae bacterium]